MPDTNEAKLISKWYLGLAGLGVGLRLLFLLLARDIEPYADESGYIYLPSAGTTSASTATAATTSGRRAIRSFCR